MRVLIASDLSEASNEAVQQGVQMAAGGEIGLCHVMPELGTHALWAQDYEDDVNKQLSLQPRVAEALRGQYTRLFPDGPTPEVFIELGSDYDQILHRAEAFRADVIALGTHGKKGLRRWLLGSVADQVVRAAHCDVLIARKSREGAILAATDLTEPGLPAIESAAREATRRKRRLVIMHAMEMPREGDAAMGLLGALPALDTPEVRQSKRALAREIIVNALAHLRAEGQVVIADEDALEETLQLAKTLPTELIIVGTHGRSGLARVVLGSRASQIIEKAPCSVLVARHAGSASID